jgi:hypothetical protein
MNGMRTLLIVALLLGAWLPASGCSKNTTSPGVANVVFDSTTVDTVAFIQFQAFAVHNAGSATAYHVRVYWSFAGDSARLAVTEPPDLAKGQSAHALGAASGNIAWTYPTQPDSIRWSAAP